MDTPLKIWYCDVCHKPINSIEDALVVFKDDNLGASNFRIVHKDSVNKKGCDLNALDASIHLKDLLGYEGSAHLLSFLSHGKAIRDNCNRVKNLDEFVDLFHRCQTPHYEQARKYFHTEKTQYLLQGCHEYYPYTQEVLKEIININI